MTIIKNIADLRIDVDNLKKKDDELTKLKNIIISMEQFITEQLGYKRDDDDSGD